VGFENVLRGILCRVELVDVDESGELAGEKVATVGENDLTTLLDRQVFVLLDGVLEDVHHPDSVEETDYDLEASGVESHTEGVISELLINLKFEAH